MQVTCPNCGEKVTAENINIQKMTAVCAACDTVFPFELPKAKTKQRKVKQPDKVTVRDSDDLLHMEFWTNFRLDRNEAVISSTIGGVSMTFVALALLVGLGRGGIPFVIPLMLLLIAAGFFYSLALTVVNKTHIEMDEDAIRVTRKPLPNPLNQGCEVPLAGVTAIKYEETAVSKKEGYDTPRYQVWAETADSRRRTIVNDVTEDYAVFIAQSLEERLYMDMDADMDANMDVDVSRLEDSELRLNDDAELVEPVRESHNRARG